MELLKTSSGLHDNFRFRSLCLPTFLCFHRLFCVLLASRSLCYKKKDLSWYMWCGTWEKDDLRSLIPLMLWVMWRDCPHCWMLGLSTLCKEHNHPCLAALNGRLWTAVDCELEESTSVQSMCRTEKVAPNQKWSVWLLSALLQNIP